MEKGYYKTFQLNTKTLEQNGVFVGTLKLPKNVKFLSICGDSRYPYDPTFCISVLGNFSKPDEFVEYHFMAIWHSYNQLEIPVNDKYQYIGLASRPNGYNSVSSIINYDVFVKKS